MKKILSGLIIANVLVCGVLLGGCLRKTPATEKVEVTRIVTESEEGIYLEDGQEFIEFSDGSWAIYGNDEYIFQPVDLGDWDYEVESQEQLEKIIKTYLSMKNEGVF